MFSKTVASNRTGSWSTTPKRPRSHWRSSSRMSTPSSRIWRAIWQAWRHSGAQIAVTFHAFNQCSIFLCRATHAWHDPLTDRWLEHTLPSTVAVRNPRIIFLYKVNNLFLQNISGFAVLWTTQWTIRWNGLALDVDQSLLFLPPTHRGLRGHPYKVLQGTSHLRQERVSFSVGVVKYWHKLSAFVATVPSVNIS